MDDPGTMPGPAVPDDMSKIPGEMPDDSADDHPDDAIGYAVGFEHTLSATVAQVLSAPAAAEPAQFAPKALGTLNIVGEIAAENIETDVVSTFAVVGSIDLEAMTMEVNRAGGVVLPAGGYLLSAAFRTDDDRYQFAASASLVVEDLSDNTVSWLVRPVLGEQVVTVESVTLLAQATFAYPTHELSEFSAPKLGVIVDGGDESVLDINPETGVTEVALGIEQGAHEVRLKLYDGSRQLGKSHPEQEDVSIDLGEDFQIDLVPLAGSVGSDFNVATGELDVSVSVPGDVVDEIGELAKLRVEYAVASSLNELKEGTLAVADTPDENGNYASAATISGLVADDDVDLAIRFVDIGEDGEDDDATLGACVLEEIALDSDGESHTCALTLARPSLVSGRLMTLTRVHAFGRDDQPVAGATVRVDDEARGLTDESGVLDFYAEAADPVVIVVDHPNDADYGRVEADLSAALGVYNVDVVLDQLTPSFRELAPLSLGTQHSCRLHGSGQVQCWGRNNQGQLGIGNTTAYNTPQTVSGISTATQVDTGDDHSCAVLEDRTVHCWGRNHYGQLGNGSTTNRYTPIQVSGLNDVVQISLGYYHTCALRANGAVSCWGFNTHGEIGVGNTTSQYNTPQNVTDLNDIAHIHALGFHTCAQRDSGAVSCWGRNDYGQLGNGTIYHQTRPVLIEHLGDTDQVALGLHHTCAISSEGTVSCWGRNDGGQLGDGTTTSSPNPVVVAGLDSVRQLSLGQHHSCALRDAGDVVCWGHSNYGQLGNGATVNQSTPQPVSGIDNARQLFVGHYNACALTDDDALLCWGRNHYGQTLANGNTTAVLTTPQPSAALE